jgi:hypothetical protein
VLGSGTIGGAESRIVKQREARAGTRAAPVGVC